MIFVPLRRYVKIIKLYTLFLFLLFPSNVYCEKLIAVSDTWSPFFLESNGQYSGIGFEVLTEVVRRTGDIVTIKNVPNRRSQIMFEGKEVDIMVLDSPLWNDPKKAKSMVFSDKVMSVQEYIYFSRGKYFDVKKPKDLAGRTVNIMRGYYYPVFEKAFKTGMVLKNEVNSESSLIRMLVSKRIDAIFMDSIAFRYTISKLGYDQKLFKRGLQLSDTSLCIKVRREKAYILPRFNSAISSMKKDGTIDKIIKKYTRGLKD